VSAPDGDSYLMLCECERSDCLNRLTVPAVVYEEVRRDRNRFLVIAGHEDPGVERLVAGDEYCIVRVPPLVLEFDALNSLPVA
jgi:hypothetical protein